MAGKFDKTLFVKCANDRCGVKYHPHKSSAALPMTFCGFFCEKGALGFSMFALEPVFAATPAMTMSHSAPTAASAATA